jgi:pyrroline-5-carboxylate reductase
MGEQIAILGAGVMGETLLAGLLRAGWTTDDVVITERRADRAVELAERYGVAAVGNAEAVAGADTVVMVVKPQDIATLLSEIGPVLRADALVVCIAAGITTAFVEERLPDAVAVVRVMPNTPALVDQGMAAISPGKHCDAAHLSRARALLEATGKVVEVPEYHQDAITAISGSGPAYIFYVVEAMIEAGVLLGLPRTTATELVVQVSSPAGTTMAALRELDDHKVRAAFLTAMVAARDRSRELSSGSA